MPPIWSMPATAAWIWPAGRCVWSSSRLAARLDPGRALGREQPRQLDLPAGAAPGFERIGIEAETEGLGLGQAGLQLDVAGLGRSEQRVDLGQDRALGGERDIHHLLGGGACRVAPQMRLESGRRARAASRMPGAVKARARLRDDQRQPLGARD